MTKEQALASLNALAAAARQAALTWDEHQAAAQAYTRLQGMIHEGFAPAAEGPAVEPKKAQE